MARFTEADRVMIWEMREAGVPVKRIAKHLGRQNSSLRKFIADAGGRRPHERGRAELRLSLEEREEISRGLAAGLSIRVISTGLGRAPSTVCREVNANGGRQHCALRRFPYTDSDRFRTPIPIVSVHRGAVALA
jgi:IS30 family transposase